MKTIIKYTGIIIFGILFTALSFGKSPDTLSCLQLSGKIVKLKATSNTYTVSLINMNTVIETKIVKGSSDFKFNLKKNNFYTVRISKEGYVSKTVNIDTKLAEENDGFYKFCFDAELIDEEKALSLNKDALEMPIAHISFDTKKRWFSHNTNYTKQVKRDIYNRHVQLNK